MRRLRRRHEHRPHAAHHPHQGRHRRGARRRHAALRLRSRRRRGRDRAEGLGLPRRHPRAPGTARRAAAPVARSRRRASASCSSTTRTPSSTRSPTISARPAPRSSTVRSRLPGRGARRVKPDLVVLSPGPGTPRDFDWPAPSRRWCGATCRSSASASACRAWSSTSAARSACSTTRCTASRRASACSGGRLFDGLPDRVHRRPLPLALRDPRAPARRHFMVTAETRGRRHHGDRAPHAADRRRAVPSGVDHDARRRTWGCGCWRT